MQYLKIILKKNEKQNFVIQDFLKYINHISSRAALKNYLNYIEKN